MVYKNLLIQFSTLESCAENIRRAITWFFPQIATVSKHLLVRNGGGNHQMMQTYIYGTYTLPCLHKAAFMKCFLCVVD
jgi:hypothetical protein